MNPALVKLRKQIIIGENTAHPQLKSLYDFINDCYTKLSIHNWSFKTPEIQEKYNVDFNKLSQQRFQYILSQEPPLMDVSTNFILPYIDMELKIIDFDNGSYPTNKISVSMMTDFYLLIDSLQGKLLISSKDNEDSLRKGEHFAESYFIQLPADVIIGSYKPIQH